MKLWGYLLTILSIVLFNGCLPEVPSAPETTDTLTTSITTSSTIDTGSDSDTMTAFNMAPEAPSMSITPTAPQAGTDDLVCVVDVESYDADGDSVIAIPDDSDFGFGSSDFTISLWYRYNSGEDTTMIAQSATHSGGGSNGDDAFWMGIESLGATEMAWIHTYDGGGDQPLYFNASLDMQWRHLAIIRSGGSVSAYIDGVKEGSLSVDTIWDSSLELTIGATSNTPYGGFIGDIDEVSIWRQALDLTQILDFSGNEDCP